MRPPITYWALGIGMAFFLIILAALEYELEATLLSFLYFSILFILAVRWSIRQIKAVIQLKSEKKKTELMHLKSQVSPHFFFNMLNNLYGLVEKDAQKARILILKLSDMMRYSIYEGERDLVNLAEEVDYLQNYIELHQMRYHKKINVRFHIQLQEKEYLVMPLLFIILLENAFKHGVENLRKNAYVDINLIGDENQIHFSITNNFDASETDHPPGIGLKNLSRRLELAYPNQHELSFSITENEYQANLTLYNYDSVPNH